jgi:hypothetical protein
MRIGLIVFFSMLLTGCASHALVGNFRAKSGERLEIHWDGRILFRAQGAAVLVGRIEQQDGVFELMTRRDDQPHVIMADYPLPNCLCAGMRITYADDRGAVAVEWPSGFDKHDWPVVFTKE